MDEHEEYRVTAEAIHALAERGLAAVNDQDHAEAVMVYNLLKQFSHALVLTGTVNASNELKREMLPEEYLTEDHTGATHPLSGQGDPGQYL